MRKLILLVSLCLFTLSLSAAIPDSIFRAASTLKDTAAIDYLLNYAENNYQKSFDDNVQLMDSLVGTASKLKYNKGLAKAKKLRGLAYYYKGDYTAATKLFMESLQVSEKSGDYRAEAEVCNELGNMFRKHNDINHAVSYLNHAMRLYTQLNDTDGLANTNNNIGVVFETLGKLDSAMSHYQRAMSLYQSIGSTVGMSYSLDYIGLIYSYKEDYPRAVASLEKSLQLREQLGDKMALAVSLVNLGELHLKMGHTDTAIRHFERSSALADSLKFLDLLSYTYLMLSEAQAGKGNYKPAFELHKKYTQLNDSLFNLSRTQQITEIQTRYETEKKEKENALLKTANNEKELRITRQRVQMAVLAGIFLTALLTAFLFHNRNKLQQERRLNEEVKRQETMRLKAVMDSQENERQRIAAELHDGLGQVLSAARVNLASTPGSRSEPAAAEALQLIDRSCKELREISHNMMPTLLVRAGITEALREIAERLPAAGGLHMSIDAEEDLPRLSPDREIHLFRILQELINNVLKYARASELQIQLLRDEEKMLVMVEDNGCGFDVSTLQTARGNGWHNIESRLKLLEGHAEVDSRQDAGTVVTLELPLG